MWTHDEDGSIKYLFGSVIHFEKYCISSNVKRTNIIDIAFVCSFLFLFCFPRKRLHFLLCQKHTPRRGILRKKVSFLFLYLLTVKNVLFESSRLKPNTTCFSLDWHGHIAFQTGLMRFYADK